MPGKKKGKSKKGKSKKSSSKSLKENASPADPIAPAYVPPAPKPGESVSNDTFPIRYKKSLQFKVSLRVVCDTLTYIR